MIGAERQSTDGLLLQAKDPSQRSLREGIEVCADTGHETKRALSLGRILWPPNARRQDLSTSMVTRLGNPLIVLHTPLYSLAGSSLTGRPLGTRSGMSSRRS